MAKQKAQSPKQKATGGHWELSIKFFDAQGTHQPRGDRTITWAESYLRREAVQIGDLLRLWTRSRLDAIYAYPLSPSSVERQERAERMAKTEDVDSELVR